MAGFFSARIHALYPTFVLIVCMLCASCATEQSKSPLPFLEGSVWHFTNDDGVLELSFRKDGVISLYARTLDVSGLFFDLGEGLYLLSFGGESVDVVRIAYDMFSFLGMVFVQQPGGTKGTLSGTQWTAVQGAFQHTLNFKSESVLWTCTAELYGTYTASLEDVLYCTFESIGTVEVRVRGDTLSVGEFVFQNSQAFLSTE
ncbi:MAG: hypothetical protein LBO67_10100 [Spirochaetaceae bacterium]|jgi:hypothetical protein|nr:hypothetical protein [Spirochaetaceae bacterium]